MFKQTLINIREYWSIGEENIQSMSTTFTFCLVMNGIITKTQYIEGTNWEEKKMLMCNLEREIKESLKTKKTTEKVLLQACSFLSGLLSIYLHFATFIFFFTEFLFRTFKSRWKLYCKKEKIF